MSQVEWEIGGDAVWGIGWSERGCTLVVKLKQRYVTMGDMRGTPLSNYPLSRLIAPPFLRVRGEGDVDRNIEIRGG